MPVNKAKLINLSSRQETLLQQIVKNTTNPYRLVRRAKLILGAASRESNSSISRRLELERGQVRLWRERWREEQACTSSSRRREQVTDKKLMILIKQVLEDRPRSGTSRFFSVEQVVQKEF